MDIKKGDTIYLRCKVVSIMTSENIGFYKLRPYGLREGIRIEDFVLVYDKEVEKNE